MIAMGAGPRNPPSIDPPTPVHPGFTQRGAPAGPSIRRGGESSRGHMHNVLRYSSVGSSVSINDRLPDSGRDRVLAPYGLQEKLLVSDL